MLWEEKFTGEKKLLSAVNMKYFVRRNVRKHIEIRGSDKYVTLDVSLKFDSLEKLKSHLQSQKKNWNDQERGLLPLWLSRSKNGKRNIKR